MESNVEKRMYIESKLGINFNKKVRKVLGLSVRLVKFAVHCHFLLLILSKKSRH